MFNEEQKRKKLIKVFTQLSPSTPITLNAIKKENQHKNMFQHAIKRARRFMGNFGKENLFEFIFPATSRRDETSVCLVPQLFSSFYVMTILISKN